MLDVPEEALPCHGRYVARLHFTGDFAAIAAANNLLAALLDNPHHGNVLDVHVDHPSPGEGWSTSTTGGCATR